MNNYYFPTLWYGERVRALVDYQDIHYGKAYNIYDLNENGDVRVSFYDWKCNEQYCLPEWYAPNNFRLDNF